jgi:electron transfer flavoprotein alpha subunit
MTILVIAEHDNQTLNPATLATLGAAEMLGQGVDLLVAGHDCATVIEAAQQVTTVTRVLSCEHEAYAHSLAENLAWLVSNLVKEHRYDYVLAPADTFGKDFMPRAAALCDSQQISDIIEVIDGERFKRPIYAGNAIETVHVTEATKFITVRPTAFDKVAATGGSADHVSVEAAGAYDKARFVELQQTESERPELTSADIVISGGRGLGDGDTFHAVLEPLADKLGAAIGASRAAVDAGYVPNDYQVGQTGKVVAPQLYIAVGISGAIQHLAGMKESKVIVAINKDENAPIFDVADYGLVADLHDAVPELVAKL